MSGFTPELREKLLEILRVSPNAERAVDAIEKAIFRSGASSPIFVPPRFKLPDERGGSTGELTVNPGGDDELCWRVTLGYYPDGQLGEIFVRQEKEGGMFGGLLDAVATVASIALQHGIPWDTLAGKLAHVRFPPNGMTLDDDNDLKIVASPLDYLARWVSRRVRNAGG